MSKDSNKPLRGLNDDEVVLIVTDEAGAARNPFWPSGWRCPNCGGTITDGGDVFICYGCGHTYDG